MINKIGVVMIRKEKKKIKKIKEESISIAVKSKIYVYLSKVSKTSKKESHKVQN